MSKPLFAAIFGACLTLSAPAVAECRFTLNFAHGSTQISLADRQLLGDLARAYPAGPISLSSHADDDGSPQANMRISQARAERVTAQLRRSGVQPGAFVQSLALGAEWDVIPTHASSPLNRRVELFIGNCNPDLHPQSRPLNAPGVRFKSPERVRLTSPRLPRP